MLTTYRTIDRYIHLPTAGGADDRLRAGQPLGSGVMQILASNATHIARANSLRTLWQSPGEGNIAGTLGFGASAGITTRPDLFDWDASPYSGTGVMVYFAGVHRIRPYGETGQWPRVVLSARIGAGGTSTAGIILCGRPAMGRPQPDDLYATATNTGPTLARVTATIYPTDRSVGPRLVAPLDETTTPSPPPAEMGRDTVMAIYIGVWTDGAGKANARGLTLYLAAP